MQLASFIFITLIVCRIEAQNSGSLTQQQPGSNPAAVSPVTGTTDNLTPGSTAPTTPPTGGNDPTTTSLFSGSGANGSGATTAPSSPPGQPNPSGAGSPTTSPTSTSSDAPEGADDDSVTDNSSGNNPTNPNPTNPSVAGNPTVSLSGAQQGTPQPASSSPYDPSGSSGGGAGGLGGGASGAGGGAGGNGAYTGNGGNGANTGNGGVTGGSTQEPQQISLSCTDAYLPLSDDDLEAMANEGADQGASAANAAPTAASGQPTNPTGGYKMRRGLPNDPSQGYLQPPNNGSISGGSQINQAACKGPQTKKGALCSYASCKVDPANPPVCKKCKLADASSFPAPGGNGQGQPGAYGAPSQTGAPAQTGAGAQIGIRLRARQVSAAAPSSVSPVGTATSPTAASGTGTTPYGGVVQPTPGGDGNFQSTPGYYEELKCSEHYYFHGDDASLPRICGAADKQDYTCDGECVGGLTCGTCVDLDDPALQDPQQGGAQQPTGPAQPPAGSSQQPAPVPSQQPSQQSPPSPQAQAATQRK